MFERVLVAVDGSEQAWRGALVGDRLATRAAAPLELVQVIDQDGDPASAEHHLLTQLSARPLAGGRPRLTVERSAPTPAATLVRRLGAGPGTVGVMATRGRGRTAALFGSVASEVLSAGHGPLVMVGPHVDIEQITCGAELVVTVDGSARSEVALGLAGAVGIALDLRPWVVEVTGPGDGRPPDEAESGHVARLARDLAGRSGRAVEFATLHGVDAGRTVAAFATDVGAALVVASTHGRYGLDRLTHGSVAADIVRLSTCPVLVVSPPDVPVPATRVGDIDLADR